MIQEPYVQGIATRSRNESVEPFRTEFRRSLYRRGLRGVKRVIRHSHRGIKAAAAKVLKANWQRRRVHFIA